MKDVLLYFSLKYSGDFNKIYKALEVKEKIDYELFMKLKENLNIDYITLVDDNYPEELKQINCPPFVLYYTGNISLLQSRKTAVVGNDDNTCLVTALVKDIVDNDSVIIRNISDSNNISKIIDDSNGSMIAVSPTGLNLHSADMLTLKSDKYLIISEFPDRVQPESNQMLYSNRLVSGLCKYFVVTECSAEGMEFITIKFALNQGKEVFCVPAGFDAKNQGCNELIKNGANLFTCFNDFSEVI